VASEFGGAAKIFGDSGDYERGGGVCDDDVKSRAGFACQQGTNQIRVVLRGPSLDGFEWGSRNAEVFRCNDESPHVAVADFGDLRFPGKRDFVETAGAMHDECAMRAKLREGGRDGVNHICGENAEHLRFSARGVGERAEKIKHRAFHDLLARGCGVARCRVGRGSEQKTDANLAHRAASRGHWEIDAHAEGFENIRGAAAGTDGAVAMLGNTGTSRGGDDRRGRGNVECAGIVATCAAGIDESRGSRLIGRKNRRGMIAHNAGEPG